MVKISAVDLEYPVVGFNPSEGTLFFDELTLLTSSHPAYVRGNSFLGMELVDNRLRRWTVKSLLLDKPLPKKRWWQFSEPFATFDLELDEVSPISLDELRKRLIPEYEEEFPEDVEIIAAAPDLATMVEQTNTQTSGLL